MSGFHRPTYLSQWHQTRKEVMNQQLMRVTFDLILLRRWVWFGQWRSAMSAECECLSRSYELCAHGRQVEGQKLAEAVSRLMSSKPRPPALLDVNGFSPPDQVLLEKDAIIKFLLLVRQPSTSDRREVSDFLIGCN